METLDLKIKQQLLDHLFVNTAKAIFFTIILAFLIIGYVHYTGLSFANTWRWLGSLTVILLFRLMIAIIAKKDNTHKAFFYYGLLIGSGFLLGCLLGGFYWAFFYEMTIFQRMILLLFFTGLTAGSTISMAASSLSFATFVLPIYIPIMMRNFLNGDHDSHMVAIVVAIFMGYLLIIYASNKKLLKRNIELLVHQHEYNEQLKQFNQKLSIVSITDELTNLANRRYFQERLIADWVRSKRSRLPLSLLIIDIDFFKECNDHYGHLYGDECLKQIAKLISLAVKREADLAARYGGDEMVIILFNTPLSEAFVFATDLQESVSALSIKHQYSRASDKLSVSIGLACMIPDIYDDYEMLFDNADKALYKAKIKGRNCICVHESTNDYQN